MKSKKLCGGNATFVGLHEVGAYGNRHSLMPDLNGDEWTGCPKWLDEQCGNRIIGRGIKEKCGILGKQEAAFVISTPISVKTLCPKVVRWIGCAYFNDLRSNGRRFSIWPIERTVVTIPVQK